MSRVIPMDEALTDEDRRYLRSRGAFGDSLEKRLDEQYPPDAAKLEKFETAERKAAAEINGVGLSPDDQTALADENARLRAELAALRSGGQEPAPPVSSYSGWTKAQLEAEIDRVNGEDADAKLAKGKVADMAAALTAYFAE